MDGLRLRKKLKVVRLFPQTRAVHSFSLFYFTRVKVDFHCRVILPTLACVNFSFKTGSTRVK